MIGCLPTQALAFLAVFVYATQAIAFEWKPGFTHEEALVKTRPIFNAHITVNCETWSSPISKEQFTIINGYQSANLKQLS